MIHIETATWTAIYLRWTRITWANHETPIFLDVFIHKHDTLQVSPSGTLGQLQPAKKHQPAYRNYPPKNVGYCRTVVRRYTYSRRVHSDSLNQQRSTNMPGAYFTNELIIGDLINVFKNMTCWRHSLTLDSQSGNLSHPRDTILLCSIIFFREKNA